MATRESKAWYHTSKTMFFLIILDFRPQNKEKLFNLHHSSARNAIEHIFGILKRRFWILIIPPEYKMDLQVRIPMALCAIHNFICQHDPEEIHDFDMPTNDTEGEEDHDRGNLAAGPAAHASRDRTTLMRDEIAQKMWDNYLSLRVEEQ
jgi:hypothetical protein